MSTRARRDRLFIIAEIMDAAKEGVLKTNLMYEVGLSFSDLNQYITFLLKRDLLEVTAKRGHRVYKTTKKGLKYLDNYRDIRALVDARVHKEYAIRSPFDSMKSEIRRIKRSIRVLETSLARQEQCPACGKKIFTDFRLCPYCGKELHAQGDSQAPKKKIEKSR